jgi:hypothetical protein
MIMTSVFAAFAVTIALHSLRVVVDAQDLLLEKSWGGM